MSLHLTLLVTVGGNHHHLHFTPRKPRLGHEVEEPRFEPITANAAAYALNSGFPATWEPLGLKSSLNRKVVTSFKTRRWDKDVWAKGGLDTLFTLHTWAARGLKGGASHDVTRRTGIFGDRQEQNWVHGLSKQR